MPSDARELFRRWGWLQADLDPLGRLRPEAHAELDEVSGEDAAPWRRIYCGAIGAEFMHIADPQRRAWIAERMEAGPGDIDGDAVLKQLAEAEIFEQFMHARYVGSKRYSLEGAAGLAPLLHAVLDTAAADGARAAVVAMSHRGRLSIMANVVGVRARDIFVGFQDVDPRSFLGSGDVKYHLGATATRRTASGHEVDMHLVSNPSHLEAVDPVALGRVRARQDRIGAKGRNQVLGITIHGDAAFAGQGIAAETLNLANLRGCSVGGTVHIVVNNLIGFTTDPPDLYSSRSATDLARRLSVPVFHVNGEKPEALVHVGRMASDFRDRFGTDVVIDLVCFRRHGHSEVDDPTTTQPRLYAQIEEWPRLWETWARQLGRTDEECRALHDGIETCLQEALEEARQASKPAVLRQLRRYWDPYRGGRYTSDLEVDTGVPAQRLEDIGERLTTPPEGFHVHPKVVKGLEGRRAQGRGERPVDWSTAEAFALGSLLWDGIRVRLSGQDSVRGTFNQRHAVLFDIESGDTYMPLAHLHDDQGACDIINSSLSEAAELGFAYGYSRDYPEALVCWEAQFGDFVNNAQAIIDQFIASGEDKWDLLAGVVLLLPHGYEGQGPEHSSARLERFLQLAAEDNMQVCQPSNAAQYFHLLRRQVLRAWRKPLVVMTPKGLLRAESAATPRQALCEGRYRNVLPDEDIRNARRIVVCSGRIAHDLRAARRKQEIDDVAIVTIEQFYPFPQEEMAAALDAHRHARDIVWVQEEPANMGALFFMRPRLERLARGRRVSSVKRSESASPATGSQKAHALEQKTLLEVALSK